MTLTTLLPRLEGGEASRELDRLIRAALAGPDETSHIDAGGNCHRSLRTWLSDAPPYTTSLDAAIALAERVLPGWSWSVMRSGFGNPARAEIWNPRRAVEVQSYKTISETGDAALALCAAIVKAKIGEVG